MAQVLNDAEFWLSPSPFLCRQAAPLKMNNAVDGKMSSGKHQFPYDIGLLKSELYSPVDSLDSSQSDEEDFFAELNRRLAFSNSRKVSTVDLRQPPEVSKVFGESPQSILGGIGSWSGRSSHECYQSPLTGPSPPATPSEAEYDEAGLIYAAAGQVERLKMKNEGPFNCYVNGQFRLVSNTPSELKHLQPPVQNNKAADVLAHQNYLATARRAYNAGLLYDHHLQSLNNSIRHTKSTSGQSTQSPWISIHQQQRMVSNKARFQPAPLQRKESVGTGVFLPRRYDTSPAAQPLKKNVTPSAVVPAKVVQALNMSFEGMGSLSQTHYSAYAASMSQENYEALMIRRNAFLAQQHRRVARADDLAHNNNLEVCLPQEWSY